MACDPHQHHLRNASAAHVSNSGTPKMVELEIRRTGRFAGFSPSTSKLLDRRAFVWKTCWPSVAFSFDHVNQSFMSPSRMGTARAYPLLVCPESKVMKPCSQSSWRHSIDSSSPSRTPAEYAVEERLQLIGKGIPQFLVLLIGEESLASIRFSHHRKVRNGANLGWRAFPSAIECGPQDRKFAIRR